MSIEDVMVRELSLSEIVGKVIKVIESEEDPVLRLVGLVDQNKYVQFREEINETFCVGSIESFDGSVEEETEYGDLTDTFMHDLQERYPVSEVQGKVESIMIDYDARKQWRDTLILKLDEMVNQ